MEAKNFFFFSLLSLAHRRLSSDRFCFRRGEGSDGRKVRGLQGDPLPWRGMSGEVRALLASVVMVVRDRDRDRVRDGPSDCSIVLG